MTRYVTRFGSLQHYEKGGVEVINDDPRHYAFSNIFEVASKSRPYQKVAVGRNMEYVLEVIRAEATRRKVHIHIVLDFVHVNLDQVGHSMHSGIAQALEHYL